MTTDRPYASLRRSEWTAAVERFLADEGVTTTLIRVEMPNADRLSNTARRNRGYRPTVGSSAWWKVQVAVGEHDATPWINDGLTVEQSAWVGLHRRKRDAEAEAAVAEATLRKALVGAHMDVA